MVASAHPWVPPCRTSRRPLALPAGYPRRSRRSGGRRTRSARRWRGPPPRPARRTARGRAPDPPCRADARPEGLEGRQAMRGRELWGTCRWLRVATLSPGRRGYRQLPQCERRETKGRAATDECWFCLRPARCTGCLGRNWATLPADAIPARHHALPAGPAGGAGGLGGLRGCLPARRPPGVRVARRGEPISAGRRRVPQTGHARGVISRARPAARRSPPATPSTSGRPP